MKRTALIVVAVGLLASAAATPALAQSDETQPQLRVALNQNGSAQVTVQLTYDLTSESQQAAFQELQANDTMQDAIVSRFRDRMSRVADAMAADTGRNVAIADPSIDLSTADDGRTGVVELSVNWDGFAARSDGRLTVSNPFDENYDPDRRVVIVGPPGYEPTTVQPSATATDGRTLQWSPDADLSGFEVTYADTDGDAAGTTADTDGTSGQGAGFGLGVALLALLTAGALARRRQ